MKIYKFSKIFNFLPKSKIKAGDGKKEGEYPLYTSSPILSKYSNEYLYENESLVFGTGGQPSLHYVNNKFSTSTDCFTVEKKDEFEKKVYTKYVYYFFKSNNKILEDGFKGAGLKHISKKYLSNINIPLPKSIDDQIKIANLLSQVEILIAKRKESIDLLEVLLRSTFLDMFGDPILNTKAWEVQPLKRFGNISTGNTPPRKEDKYYDEKYIEWIKTDNIEVDKMYLTKAREYLSEEGLKKGRSVNTGSLLVTCIAGSLKSIGNASLTDRKVAFNQQINVIEPFEEVNSYFLYWLVKISKEYIQNQAGKGMKKMITKSSFEKITFPKPDKTLQDKFATIVQQVDATKEHYQDSLDELNELFGSLSQRAFRGELDLGDDSIINKDWLNKVFSFNTDMSKKYFPDEIFKKSKKTEVQTLLQKLESAKKSLKSTQDWDYKLFSLKIAIDQYNSKEIHLIDEILEYIETILQNIPQTKIAMDEGVLSRKDFLELPVKVTYEYSDIKALIITKLKSGEIAQKFDEASKSIKLVKAT